MRNNVRKKVDLDWGIPLFSAFTAGSVLCLLIFTLNFAPFGGFSLAWEDANIQYIEFFSYLKDVLAGDNSGVYSFTKMLGGNTFGIVSYYLMSPFNLLVALFPQKHLHVFHHVLVLIKLPLAALTCAVFLRIRFAQALGKCNRQWGALITWLLPVGYALGQYSIAQASNIMWLDGLYMLPLMLLGVYRVVQEKSVLHLAVPTALAIVFNWYMAGVNCLFAGAWFLMELGLRIVDDTEYLRKSALPCALRALGAMVLAVGLSGVVFVPTISALQNSSKGSLELNIFSDMSVLGKLPDVLQAYTFGAVSTTGFPALFCGTLPLIGGVSCMACAEIPKPKRYVLMGMLGLVLVSFFWEPVFKLFCLFKPASSFWYRYSHIGILFLVFAAAYFFLHCSANRRWAVIKPVTLGISGVMMFVHYADEKANNDMLYLTLLALLCAAGLLWLVSEKRMLQSLRRGAGLLLAVCMLLELGHNAKLLMWYYCNTNVYGYQTYVTDTNRQLDEIRQADGGLYRISQTSTREMNAKSSHTAYYNESLGYNYMGIAGYSSAPDGNQLGMLARMGYRTEADIISVVNTSLVAADTLLGVKYVMSYRPINGLVPDNRFGDAEKAIYRNPYSLPLAFVYSDSKSDAAESENPFVYQNALYSQLLGRTVELYRPVAFTVSGGSTNKTYELQLESGNFSVYGNLPWHKNLGATITLEDGRNLVYAQWLSQSVFDIPTAPGQVTAVVQVKAAGADVMAWGEEQFYALDLDMLSRVTRELSERPVKELVLENGAVRIVADGKENDMLFTSIPADKGWRITLNGKPVEPRLLGDCLYQIPLEAGENVIKMNYSLPGFVPGLGMSLLGLAVALLLRKRKVSLF